MRSFLKEITNRVLICDGAMGTMLYDRGIFVNRAFEELNLTRPELVELIHCAYLNAGADVIETNTFGANRLKLHGFGLAEKLVELNIAGVDLARRVAGPKTYVAGAIGPLGVSILSDNRCSAADAEEYFHEQAEALQNGGVDLFILETFRSVEELLIAVRAIRVMSDLPIVAQLTITESGESPDGIKPEIFSKQLDRAGASVVGVNCGTGPAPMLETVERLERAINCPLAAQPNTGLPRQVEGRMMYMASPEYMASYARRFVKHGVKLVGGCCGTTPEHIREIKAALN